MYSDMHDEFIVADVPPGEEKFLGKIFRSNSKVHSNLMSKLPKNIEEWEIRESEPDFDIGRQLKEYFLNSSYTRGLGVQSVKYYFDGNFNITFEQYNRKHLKFTIKPVKDKFDIIHDGEKINGNPVNFIALKRILKTLLSETY